MAARRCNAAGLAGSGVPAPPSFAGRPRFEERRRAVSTVVERIRGFAVRFELAVQTANSCARNHHADATPPSSDSCLRGRRRHRGLQRLGQRGPAVARRASRLHDRRGQFLARRRERLGPGHDQSAADHRRPPLGGCGCAGRNPGRRRDDSHERRHGRVRAQSRRPHRPAAVDAGHAERPRAPSRAQPGVRGRHAESRLHAAAARRIPDRGGSRRQCDRHRRAQGPGRGVRRRRRLRRSTRGSRIASRAPACASTEYVDAPRLDEFDRWASDRDRSYDNSVSARYVSQDVVGYQDLDANGTWRVDADLRQRLDPESRGRRLGALPRRTLGMGRPVGLDVGG